MEKKFWAKAAMLGVLATVGGQKDLNAQQKEPQKTEQSSEAGKGIMREKTGGYLDVEDNAKKFNEIEALEYKKYLQAPKDSKEERDLFNRLFDNNSNLKKQLLKLMTYSTDKNSGISGAAMKVFLEINKGIKERKKECSDAGKNYFDRIPSPPPLPKD